MRAFIYSLFLQLKLDSRKGNILVTYYIIPLIFFALMSGIFVSIMPEMKGRLIQSMCVMAVSMGAYLGMPGSMHEIFQSDIKKMYKVNNIPIAVAVSTILISAFIHLFICCGIIYFAAQKFFKAQAPADQGLFFAALALFLFVSLTFAVILPLVVSDQSKLNMAGQVFFLPSILLSGIMFSSELLPDFLNKSARIFPAYSGFRLMIDEGFKKQNYLPLLIIFLIALALIIFLSEYRKRKKA